VRLRGEEKAMTNNPGALAFATAIAEIAELDGKEAAQRASVDKAAFQAAVRRVIATKTAAAMKWCEAAQSAVTKIGKETNLDDPFRAYETVIGPAAEVDVCAQIVKEIAALDAAAFVDEIARVAEAQDAATDACTAALVALGLDPHGP
jgi:hypothetical protein